MIETIVGLVENLTPIALIGAGGIGKTSIVLVVLHHWRIKERFGDDRRFIRCDQFPASRTHFLNRLSKAIGAGVENPEDLTPLRPFLSSKEMLIVLDNAESVLDPQGTSAQEIYAVVEELSCFSNICLCITSRVSTVPPDCESLDIPTLSIEAARDTFYRIYKSGERTNLVNKVLEQLDFHPLSVTLLATVAHHSKWDTGRLIGEWESQRTVALHTHHGRSLAATIELSLSSPMFQALGPDARGLLGVVAFFPQGIDENNLDWLFPTISDRRNIFDRFYTLSLTYRSNGFITMLAPLRDHLSPNDPKASPLLCMAKERYFTRVSINIDPDHPDFGDSLWITSEDMNVEHLLDIFTSIDANSDDVWDACSNFMDHLYWHKPRPTVLGPTIEGLPDDHPSKPECLSDLSRLFEVIGNYAESKRLATWTLTLERERGRYHRVAQALRAISLANQELGLYEEGMQQINEALEIFKQFGDTKEQAECLLNLAWLLYYDDQLDAAEEAASRAIILTPEKGQEFRVCTSHRLLGDVYHSKGKRETAIYHFEAAIGIASSFNWHHHLFWTHYSLADLFFNEDRFDDTHAHIERARPHACNDAYRLGRVMQLQANLWYKQHRFEEARSEALRAADIYNTLGAAMDTESCRTLLRDIQKELDGRFPDISMVRSSERCHFLHAY